MKFLLKFFLLLALLATAWMGQRYWSFTRKPLHTGSDVIGIEVSAGDSLAKIIARLEEQGLRMDPFMRRIWIKRYKVERKLRIGEFELQPGWSSSRILSHLFFGNPIFRSLTVKEGSNIYDVEAIFREKKVQGAESGLQSLLRNPQLLNRMKVPANIPHQARTLEGYLFPETYSYFKSDPASKIVQAMLSEFERRALPELEKHPLGKTPEGIFQLLTLASVVEKESGNVQEQPIVASVFWNRIKKKMRLESDPTITYGLLPNFDGNIRSSDIRAPSLWNTYVIRSLPAGPIASPGLTAIKAVVNPAQTDYLFFVATGDGNHVFTTTYAEHSRNVQRYQLRR